MHRYFCNFIEKADPETLQMMSRSPISRRGAACRGRRKKTRGAAQDAKEGLAE